MFMAYQHIDKGNPQIFETKEGPELKGNEVKAIVRNGDYVECWSHSRLALEKSAKAWSSNA